MGKMRLDFGSFRKGALIPQIKVDRKNHECEKKYLTGFGIISAN